MEEKIQDSSWRESGRWLVTIMLPVAFVVIYAWTFLHAADDRTIANLALGVLSWLAGGIGYVTLRRLRRLHGLGDLIRPSFALRMLVVIAYMAGVWHFIGWIIGVFGASRDWLQVFINGPLVLIAVLAALQILVAIIERLPGIRKR